MKSLLFSEKEFFTFLCNTGPTVLLFSSCLFYMLPSFAQTQKQELSTEEVEVIKDYQPMLADAVKVSFPPEMPSLDSKQSKMKYYLPKKHMTLPYAPPPIKPLAMSTKETYDALPQASLKTGYGNYATVFLEGMYNSRRSEWFNYGAYFRHHSSKSKSIEAQDFSENLLEAYGKYFFNTMVLKSSVRASRDAVYFYGNQVKKTSKRPADMDTLQQYFNFVNYTGALSNYEPNEIGVDWKLQFKFDYLVNKNSAREWSPYAHFNAVKTFSGDDQFILDMKYDYTDYTDQVTYEVRGNSPIAIPEYDYKRGIISIQPKYKFSKNIFTLYAGLDLTFEDKKNYLFPGITTETKLMGDNLILYNGWTRYIRKNSFKSLTDENPFVSPAIAIINSKTEDRFAGIKGSFGRGFTYNARFSQKIINELPLFVNDTADMNRFKVIYDEKPQIIHLMGELSYQQSEQFRVNLGGGYFIYEMSDEEKPWHLPAYQINLGGNYLAWKKVLFATEIYLEGGVFARLKSGKASPLKDLTDLNFSTSYYFSKNLTFFVNLNNILMQKHYRWLRYPSYKENALIGVKVIF